VCIIPDSDYEDNLSEYTSPPAQENKKSLFIRPIQTTTNNLGKSHHDIIKPSKVDWSNSSRAKQLLECHSSFSENSSERERLDVSRSGFAQYYSKLKSVKRKSFGKRKDKELWPWEK
jgi:hypothetical protein